MSPQRIAAVVGSNLKRLLLRTNISIVLTVLVAAGLLAFVAGIAAHRDSGHWLWLILQRTWVLVLILTVPYLALRVLIWSNLLRALHVRVGLQSVGSAFAAGEITKTLPGGLYVQNYLLARFEKFDEFAVVRSSMSTTAMLALEAAIALPVALIFHIPGQPWVFWALMAVVIAWIVLLFLAWMLVHRWGKERRDRLPRWLNSIRELLEDFLAAGGELLRLRSLFLLFPAALYLLVYAIELFAVLQAVGVHRISFTDTMGIYALIVMVDLLVPIPTEIGLTELTGLGALLTYHVDRSKAAIVMLGLRILATGMTILLATGALILLRTTPVGGWVDELRVES